MKPLRRTQAEMIMLLTLLITATAGVLLLQLVFTKYYFSAFLVIPALYVLFMFCLMGIITTAEKKLYRGEQVMPNTRKRYMGYKIFKVAICLISVLLYYRFCGENFSSFLVTFMVYYVMYFLLETMAWSNFEKRYKLYCESLGNGEAEA